MATAFIKFLYSTWAGNILGGGLLSIWLAIDFNEIKLMVLGVISITWTIGFGIIQLWRMYIRGQKEQIELEISRMERDKKRNPKNNNNATKNK